MGILREPLQMIRDLKLPRGFSVLELGDQHVTGEGDRRLAREFYEELGCGRYVSVDGNGRGDVTYDLNKPLPRELSGFDLVTDFGTGEHVFDQRIVWQSVHYAVKPGGWIVFDRPSQGYPGHCFWRADMCVFEDLAVANGYQIRRLEEGQTTRGVLIRGVFRRSHARTKFAIPQQGRYSKILRPITEGAGR